MSPEADPGKGQTNKKQGPSWREEARAGLQATGRQLVVLRDGAVETGRKFARATGKGIDNLLVISGRGMATVGELTVSYRVLPENPSSSHSIHRGRTRSVPASRIETELGPKKSKLKRLTGGRVGQDTEALTKERIGLPAIIQIPIELCPESKLQTLFKDSKLFAGKTTPGIKDFANEKTDPNRKAPKALEVVAYLEIAPVTPDNNYQHRMRFGLATVDLSKRDNLHSLKSISIKTANSVASSSKGIDFAVEEITVDDVAERMVAWVAESDARVKKDDIYEALKIAATLNVGVGDFWKTVCARQSFETLMNMHPHVAAFSLKTFLASNDSRQASSAFDEFCSKLSKGEFKKYSDFVAGAREAAANMDPSVGLSINMGLGAIQHVMRLTTQTIVSREGAQRVIDKVRGEQGSTGKVQDELLISGDPLSVILMTPRFLTGVMEFTVTRFIPLMEETIRAQMNAVEEAMITQRSGALASAAFYRTVRTSFETHLPEIHRQLKAGGKDVAMHLGETVLEMLNAAADETLGLNPHMKFTNPANVVGGKLKELEAKAKVLGKPTNPDPKKKP